MEKLQDNGKPRSDNSVPAQFTPTAELSSIFFLICAQSKLAFKFQQLRVPATKLPVIEGSRTCKRGACGAAPQALTIAPRLIVSPTRLRMASLAGNA